MPTERRTFRNLVRRAINDCNCSRHDKIKLRFAMAMNRDLRKEVEHEAYNHLVEEGAIDDNVVFGFSEFSEIDLDKFEKFLQILIKYLPQLIEIFIGLFSSDSDTFFSVTSNPFANLPSAQGANS